MQLTLFNNEESLKQYLEWLNTDPITTIFNIPYDITIQELIAKAKYNKITQKYELCQDGNNSECKQQDKD